MKRIIMIALLVMSILAMGCDEQQTNEKTGVPAVTGQTVRNIGTNAGDSPSDDSNQEAEKELLEPAEVINDTVLPDRSEYCGDGVCNGRESCNTCRRDCGCGADELCDSGKCKVVACRSDEDCVDDDPCTVNKCYFAGDVHAYCSDEVITRAKNRDGCCPPGEYLDTDIDCEPVCGNHHCELGETKASCEADCKYAGASGGSAQPNQQTFYYPID